MTADIIFTKTINTMTNFFDTKINIDLPKGIIGCVQAAMFADGTPNDVEIERVSNLLVGRDIFADVTVGDIFKHNSGVYIGLGLDYLLKESCALVTDEWKATTYAMCCEVLFSDTQAGSTEKEFLKTLQKHLELPEEVVNKIIDVLLILHKGRLIS